jgi:hypothetical protein
MKRLVSGINHEKFKAIAADIHRRLGVALPDGKGTIDAQGFRVQIQHDAVAETLTLELLKKPWFIPDSIIEKKIDEWLSDAGAKQQGI